MDEMDEIRSFFLEEAEELFENINKILIEAEQNQELSSDDIDNLFRDVHTLKGGSGSVELNYFAKYIHYLEDFMDILRKGKLIPTMSIINFIMEELDILTDIISQEYESRIDDENFNNQIKSLKEKIDKFINKKTIKHNLVENNFNLEDYNVEFSDIISALIKFLINANNNSFNNQEYVSEVFRQLHTLKGTSSFVGLEYFPKYLHDVETLLDQARNLEICYNENFNKALIKTMVTAEEIAYEEFNNSFDINKFNIKLKETQELFKLIKDECIVPNQNVSDLGFEIFDTPIKNDNTDLGFEIFDTPIEDDIKDANTDIGFEIFDTPVKNDNLEIVKKSTLDNNKKVKSKKPASSSSIRVGLEKIDFLMNRVGDLVITKSMLYKFLEDLAEKIDDPTIIDNLDRLDREIRELQEAVMSVRMVPMESIYSKLPKVIRDLAKKLNKKVDFIHEGDSVEIDKLMVEGLNDPLTHIIRNSLDHGIGLPEDRLKKGKKELGILKISAAQESGHIIITIEDDGAGINLDKVVNKALENGIIEEKDLQHMNDNDKAMLIFSAGLSTSDEISDVSGRGVGMDVVMNNISSLGGMINIETTKDKGSKIIILLPLTLAILDGLNILIGENQLIMPLNMIIESLQPSKEMIKKIGNNQKELLMLRDEFIPIIRLHKFFNIKSTYTEIDKGMLIVTKVANMKAALFVDDFLNQEQIVVKSLEKNYKTIDGIGAATIRGDGSIGLIIDVMNIIEKEKAI